MTFERLRRAAYAAFLQAVATACQLRPPQLSNKIKVPPATQGVRLGLARPLRLAPAAAASCARHKIDVAFI